MLRRRDLLASGIGLLALAVHAPVARAQTALRGDPVPGALLRGRTVPGADVSIDGRKLNLAQSGDFAFGFAHDRKDPAVLRVRTPEGEEESRTLSFPAREYRVQRIDGLPEKFVEPPPSVLERIDRENKLIGAARARDTAEAWFAEEFSWPLEGRVTGVYGSQRILNGVPKRPHFGVDIAAPEGAPMRAPAPAVVSLVQPDLYFTGGTVILDHGRGVSTSYLHMSRIDVSLGERVAKGAVIGAVGKTGRATGPHLCWRLNWFQERLDAALLVPAMPRG